MSVVNPDIVVIGQLFRAALVLAFGKILGTSAPQLAFITFK